ncbi:MAG TPA: nucleotidyl transferase AbiEii/AbiGii toxin family protein [bacterium]|nr:nucleotidyl transferase AbiEii/AbiGii toxin family protein [bacterium]
MLRTATEKERAYYEESLYPLQDKVLARLLTDRFYLTGGTCLSRFYYDHRYSDDLDLFYDAHRFPGDEFAGAVRDVLARLGREFTVEVPNIGDQFIRSFVHDGAVVLKLEFINEPFPTIGERIVKGTFSIDTRENIAVNKITTVYDRRTVKDYVDLYHLLRDVPLNRCLELAESKIVPLDYEGVLMALADQRLEGEVLMKRPLDEREFTAFVEKLMNEVLDHAANRR